jgi:hypothetical protein
MNSIRILVASPQLAYRDSKPGTLLHLVFRLHARREPGVNQFSDPIHHKGSVFVTEPLEAQHAVHVTQDTYGLSVFILRVCLLFNDPYLYLSLERALHLDPPIGSGENEFSLVFSESHSTDSMLATPYRSIGCP